MLKKAFSSKKEIKDFKENYSKLDFKTEIISNMLQSFTVKNIKLLKAMVIFGGLQMSLNMIYYKF